MLFSASTLKLLHGGWFPLLLGAILLTIMLTWKRGRELVFENLEKHAIPLEAFLESLFVAPPTRGRHRDLPARRDRRRAACAAAQPAAQQGAARARRVPHGAHPRRAVGAGRRAGGGGRAGPQLLPAERHYGFKDEPTFPMCCACATARACRSR
jgi:KUP system potassium uptake protein